MQGHPLEEMPEVFQSKRAWLCLDADDESDGRFVFGVDHTKALTSDCPVCGFNLGYFDCRWVTITDA